MGGDFIPPDYTGQELSPNQRVTVWELVPALGTSFDMLWFKTRDDLFSWVEDYTDDLLERLHDASESGVGSVEIKVARIDTTAEEAAAVLDPC